MTISIDLDEKQIKDVKKESKSFFKKKPKTQPPLLKENKSEIKKPKNPKGKKILIYSLLFLLFGGLVYGGYRIYKIYY